MSPTETRRQHVPSLHDVIAPPHGAAGVHDAAPLGGGAALGRAGGGITYDTAAGCITCDAAAGCITCDAVAQAAWGELDRDEGVR